MLDHDYAGYISLIFDEFVTDPQCFTWLISLSTFDYDYENDPHHSDKPLKIDTLFTCQGAKIFNYKLLTYEARETFHFVEVMKYL